MNANEKKYGELFDKIGEVITEIVDRCNSEGMIVEFAGSFVVMNPEEEFKVIADRMFAYGIKDSLKIGLEGILEGIDKEKEDFVNW